MKKILSFAIMSFLVSQGLFAEDNSLKKERIGLDFTIPTSQSASIGGRLHVDDLLALQMEFEFGYQVEDTKDNQVEGGGVGLGLYVNSYLRNRRAAPYIKGGLSFAKNFGDLHKGDDDIHLTLASGLGVSYFVTKEFAIGGEVLLALPVAPAIKIGTTTTQMFATFYF